MTDVIIVAFRQLSDDRPACLLRAGPSTLLEQLAEQLTRLGAGRVRVLTRAGWADLLGRHCPALEVVSLPSRAESADAGGLLGSGTRLLIDGDLVLNDTPLQRLFAETGPAALVGPLDVPQLASAPRCTVGRDRLLELSAADHGPATHRFLRAVRLPGGDLDAADAVEDPLLTCTRRALVAGQTVRAVHLREADWGRPDDEAEAAEILARVRGHDEESLRLAAAVKAEDGWFTTHLVSPYSRHLARWAARRGLTPDQVTVASLLVGMAAAVGFATGLRPGLIAGAVLLQAAFTLDCVDGQLARYSASGTPLGGWLDAMFDRLKEFLVYAGLAIGAFRVEADPTIWQLAVAALVMQTIRHHVDLGYEAAELDRWDESPPAAAASAEGARIRSAASAVAGVGEDVHPRGLASGLIAAARRAERTGPLRWAKRIVVLPIGERFALISIVAAVAHARQVFVALLGWGLIALAYTTTGRLARSSR
jgi:hypothetical protein